MALRLQKDITSVSKVQAIASPMISMHLVASAHLTISVRRGPRVRSHANQALSIQKKAKIVVPHALPGSIVLVVLEHLLEGAVVPPPSVSKVITALLVFTNQYHVQLENMDGMVSLHIKVNRIVNDVILENIVMQKDLSNQIFRNIIQK